MNEIERLPDSGGNDPTLTSIHDIIGTLGSRAVTQAGAEGEESPGEYAHTPMKDRRPPWLAAAIDSYYGEASLAAPGYAMYGNVAGYVFGASDTTQLIADYRSGQSNRPLRIFDIGTGVGGFLTRNAWQDGDTVHGLTGYDYRNDPQYAHLAPGKDDLRYFVGNAEYLDKIPGLLDQYDVIVSKATLQHLVDGLGALEQIANRVAPGGMLCLDPGFRLQPKAVALLLQHGFSSMGISGARPEDYAENSIVLVRESDQPIRFGLGYAQKPPGYEDRLEAILGHAPTAHECHTMTWQYVSD